jgi:hypothetical protein
VPWVSDERWEEPEWSLGWEIAKWVETFLTVPGGRDYGRPLLLTGWQLRALIDWYAVDRSGRFLFRRGQLRLAKGTGKSPFAAAVAAAELCGPSQFDGWSATDEPVGRPPSAPWVVIAAASEDQAGNTYSALHAMLRESPLLDEAGIDVGLTRTILRGRPGRIEMVTASAGSREGQPITAAICDETHLWTRTNGGRRLYATIARNASKMNSRVLATTNAFVPGAESVAEQIETASLKTSGVMIYGPQYEGVVKDIADLPSLMGGLRRAYRDAPWVDLERVAADCQDPDMEPADVQRFHCNVNAAAESSLCAEPQTVALGEMFAPGAPVALGFDGSRTTDATALVALHMVHGVAVLLGYWERPYGLPRGQRWEIPRAEVTSAVEAAFARWSVARFKADPSHWLDELAGWANHYGRDVVDRFPVWMPSVVDEFTEATQTGLRTGAVKLDEGEASAVLRAHVQWCRVTHKPVGQRVLRALAKPEDGGRIDAAAALTYAVCGRLEALKKGWTEAEPAADPFVVFA